MRHTRDATYERGEQPTAKSQRRVLTLCVGLCTLYGPEATLDERGGGEDGPPSAPDSFLLIKVSVASVWVCYQWIAEVRMHTAGETISLEEVVEFPFSRPALTAVNQLPSPMTSRGPRTPILPRFDELPYWFHGLRAWGIKLGGRLSRPHTPSPATPPCPPQSLSHSTPVLRCPPSASVCHIRFARHQGPDFPQAPGSRSLARLRRPSRSP